MSTPDTPLATVDTGQRTLAAVIDDLRFHGRMTADDAAELTHRIDSLAEDITACALADPETR